MLKQTIQRARGLEKADLVLRNANVINVYSCETIFTDVAIYNHNIIGLDKEYEGSQEVDLQGMFLAPGLIDAHVHIESSMVEVPQFTRAVLPLGTTSVIADPHEIANVLGYEGIRYMMESSKYNPLNVFFTLSSCVPSSTLETAGSEMRAFDLFPFLREKWVVGLGEVMNYHGVLAAEPDVLDKLRIVENKRIDGHAPGLSGRDLNAYIAAGIESDHECTTVEEAREKLRLGMFIMIREGTGTKNLKDLLPLVTPENERRIMFCTDDRHPNDILTEGHINYMVKTAIQSGLEPCRAIRLATLNTAEYFHLDDLGAVAPGKKADLIVFDNFKTLNIKSVFKNGELVAKDGRPIYELPKRPKVNIRGSVNIPYLQEKDFAIPLKNTVARVIGIIPDQITTKSLQLEVKHQNGYVVSDTERDIIRLYVVERHLATGNIGKGLIKGFGLNRGAIATTVSHDSHNIIVVGIDDRDIYTAVTAIHRMGGGIVIVENQAVLKAIELPIAGLMSPQPLEVVSTRMNELLQTTRSLGVTLTDPIMTLSFMALPVIPSLKLTDIGLVDVETFEHVDLFV